ncbi:hypothetical protein SEPCBS119000_005115 [Sporothrix epigloea]|uniref:DUF676 domain-containing protein n=1 Tax=Sporothrix epigloea TaxID=1892477 RepID=A0ABP0DVT4_9PEZI
MPRILLLCFVHGFKGDDATFQTFPNDLKNAVAALVPDSVRVETVVYPRYETTGELAAASQKFLEWLELHVMDVREANHVPWLPENRSVEVILVAHSMGGFVAADALCLALDERRAANIKGESSSKEGILFPPIRGLLTLDTPFNGLSWTALVNSALSNARNIKTAVSVLGAAAADPVALGHFALSRAAGRPASKSRLSASSVPATVARGILQAAALRTGTVGAIAVGGVLAYTHRKSILAGVDHLRQKLNEDRADVTQEAADQNVADASGSEAKPGLKSSLRESFWSGVQAFGQGLADIKKHDASASFAWLSAHITFAGALLKRDELNHRLQRLACLRSGVGVRNLYVSLDAERSWCGDHFLPERTFCAVPKRSGDGKANTAEGKEREEGKEDSGPASLFERWTMHSCDDEVWAHLSLFKRDKNTEYDAMTKRAAELASGWFANDDPIVDAFGSRRGPCNI